jgi:hypothetical protein
VGLGAPGVGGRGTGSLRLFGLCKNVLVDIRGHSDSDGNLAQCVLEQLVRLIRLGMEVAVQ